MKWIFSRSVFGITIAITLIANIFEARYSKNFEKLQASLKSTSLDVMAGTPTANTDCSLVVVILRTFSIKSNFFGLIKDVDEDITVMSGLQVFVAFSLIFVNSVTTANYISNTNDIMMTNGNIRKVTNYIFDIFFFYNGVILCNLFYKTAIKTKWKVFEQLFHYVVMISMKICR